MNVYILDVQGQGREQMVQWLTENKKVNSIEIFEDYIQFLERTGKSPPDFCIIRLGEHTIPGLKAADMVGQMSPDTKIVFVSNDGDYALDAYEIGVYGYLLSPVEKEKFLKYFFGAA